MKQKLININQLQPNEGQIDGVAQNPRDLSKTGFDLAVKSITDFPEMLEVRTLVVVPIDNNNYMVIGGNQRLRALQHLKYKEVPCIIVNWSPEKIKEFIIKDNLEYGSWNFELLANEWDTELLIDWGMNLPLQLDEIEISNDEETVPEIPVEPVSKPGDVWILGRHRLMCGDSTLIDDVEKLMNGYKADLIFTDPPYGVKYSARKGLRSGKTRENMGMIINDDLNKDDLLDFLTDVFTNLIVVSKENTPFYICNNWKCADVFMKAFEAVNLKLNSWIIWHKEWMSIGFGHYRNNHEFIFYSHRDGSCYAPDGTLEDVWSIKKLSPDKKIHPTEKPIELIAIALQNSSQKNNIVLDLFGGSGSTLMACEKSERINYSMELDPKFCDVIIKRWQNATNAHAILESTNQKFSEIISNRE